MIMTAAKDALLPSVGAIHGAFPLHTAGFRSPQFTNGKPVVVFQASLDNFNIFNISIRPRHRLSRPSRPRDPVFAPRHNSSPDMDGNVKTARPTTANPAKALAPLSTEPSLLSAFSMPNSDNEPASVTKLFQELQAGADALELVRINRADAMQRAVDLEQVQERRLARCEILDRRLGDLIAGGEKNSNIRP
ncbi:hypothetical protein VM1G_11917 [Cytospora mali]|uniref:Uncharacterized protein n=1 Tax=Cytospora mali TaxID=578113 RepID=A0A194WA35_CYTMA|nr:hypothetical protein VM1G_11917 [Valsa mali]